MIETLRSLFDLLPDLAGIFLAAVSLAVVFLAQELEWFETHSKTRWTLAITLALVGIGGVVSNSIQKSHDKTAREKLQGDVARLKDEVAAVQNKLGENRNASVGLMAVALATLGQELKPNTDVPFFISYMVTTNTAKNIGSYQEIFSVNGSVSPEQNRVAHSKFLSRAAEKLDVRGEDRIAGTGNFRTLQLRMNSREILELLSAKRVVYIMARIEWKNVSGSDDHFDACKWMEQPKMKYLIQSQLPFHDCTL